MNVINNLDKVFKFKENYIHFFLRSDNDYEYNYYDNNFKLLDGGIIENNESLSDEKIIEYIFDMLDLKQKDKSKLIYFNKDIYEYLDADIQSEISL